MGEGQVLLPDSTTKGSGVVDDNLSGSCAITEADASIPTSCIVSEVWAVNPLVMCHPEERLASASPED